MNKVAGIMKIGIALAAHSARSMFVQGIEIMVYYFLCRLLLIAAGTEKVLTYRTIKSDFWFSTAGISMACTILKMPA